MRPKDQNRPQVLAILCSDIHLTLRPPVWRSKEPDWLAAQKRALDELKGIASDHNAPIICAGDVFNRWNAPVELVNWASEHLPHMYAIPGQHDLPYHSLEDIRKSAYWNLVRHGRLLHLDKPTRVGTELTVWPYSWGKPIQRLHGKSDHIDLAVCHQYAWVKGCGYPGAPREALLEACPEDWTGYDVIHFGDNHHAFLKDAGRTTVFNSGTLLKRKLSEKMYAPQVGLLTDDGMVTQLFLDTTEDHYLKTTDISKQIDTLLNMDAFVEELKSLGTDPLDYAAAIRQYVEGHDVSNEAERILLESIS